MLPHIVEVRVCDQDFLILLCILVEFNKWKVLYIILNSKLLQECIDFIYLYTISYIPNTFSATHSRLFGVQEIATLSKRQHLITILYTNQNQTKQ